MALPGAGRGRRLGGGLLAVDPEGVQPKAQLRVGTRHGGVGGASARRGPNPCRLPVDWSRSGARRRRWHLDRAFASGRVGPFAGRANCPRGCRGQYERQRDGPQQRGALQHGVPPPGYSTIATYQPPTRPGWLKEDAGTIWTRAVNAIRGTRFALMAVVPSALKALTARTSRQPRNLTSENDRFGSVVSFTDSTPRVATTELPLVRTAAVRVASSASSVRSGLIATAS